jgi:hypothetical protein
VRYDGCESKSSRGEAVSGLRFRRMLPITL